VPRNPFFLTCLLFLIAVHESGAQAPVIQDSAGNRLNTWTARANTGARFMGTWTAIPDSTSGNVTGTWTLIDPQGRTLADGTWSAAKSPEGWSGAWRATVTGHQGDYGGTWSVGVRLRANAPFPDLFEKAFQTVVSGNWRAGRHSGTWSIQAFK
jgi:hypothetical protein